MHNLIRRSRCLRFYYIWVLKFKASQYKLQSWFDLKLNVLSHRKCHCSPSIKLSRSPFSLIGLLSQNMENNLCVKHKKRHETHISQMKFRLKWCHNSCYYIQLCIQFFKLWNLKTKKFRLNIEMEHSLKICLHKQCNLSLVCLTWVHKNKEKTNKQTSSACVRWLKENDVLKTSNHYSRWAYISSNISVTLNKILEKSHLKSPLCSIFML